MKLHPRSITLVSSREAFFERHTHALESPDGEGLGTAFKSIGDVQRREGGTEAPK